MPQVPPTPSNTDQSKKSWYKSLQRWRTVLEIVAIPFAVLYAIVTCFQWRDLRHNFQTEQRAWLVQKATFPDDNGIKHGVGNVPIATVNISNSGKTPAKSINWQIGLEIPRSAEEVQFDYSSSNGGGFSNLLNPNTGPLFTRVKLNGDHILTQTDADDLLNGRRYIAVYGKGHYNDIFESTHWFTFCYWLWYYQGYAVYAADGCTRYNDTGDGVTEKQGNKP